MGRLVQQCPLSKLPPCRIRGEKALLTVRTPWATTKGLSLIPFMSTHAPIDGNNRNNNNNTTFATYAGFGNYMMAVNLVFIPQSPGFFMAPTGKAFFLA